MRKIVVNTFVSLDGVMQAPGGPQEDPAGGFELGGWSFNYWDELMGQKMGETMRKPFDLLLGRKTYEIFAAHWPHATDDPGAPPLEQRHQVRRHYHPRRALDLRYSAFTSLQRAGPTSESVSLLRQLTEDETLGRSARSLLSTWQQ